MIFSRCSLALRAPCQAAPRRMLWTSKFAKNGTPEMILGFAIIAVVAIDQGLAYRQRTEREALLNQLRSEFRRSQNSKEQDDWYNMPPLFMCIVRKKPVNLDGFKCLTGVDVGDTVQVLQEKVGPNEMYNLCRSVDEKGRAIAVGWFPTQYLEKQ
jgi:hypothetical protein